jgi:sphinganine-1-phosphate aldolase
LKLLQATVPGLKKAVQGSIAKTIASVEASVAPSIPGEHKYASLPQTGLSRKALRAELDRYHALGQVSWSDGRVSGAVYHGGEELNGIVTEAYGLFSMANVRLLYIAELNI